MSIDSTHMMNYMFRDSVYTTYQTLINWFSYILFFPLVKNIKLPMFLALSYGTTGLLSSSILFPHIFHYLKKNIPERAH